MKKLIHTLKTYDYDTKATADKDKPEMQKKGWYVRNEYQAENTYVVEYEKNSF